MNDELLKMIKTMEPGQTRFIHTQELVAIHCYSKEGTSGKFTETESLAGSAKNIGTSAVVEISRAIKKHHLPWTA